jgi:urease beta subunit
MKRILFVMLMAIALARVASAQAQSSGMMVVSKQGNGPILRQSLSLSLSSAQDCDQTRDRIPDGSRMSSDSFALNVNDAGVGTFYGSVTIVSPAGAVLQVGILRGTVGINSGCDGSASCRKAWHLEGIYEPAPTFVANPNGSIVMATFRADLDERVASPLPTYRARLDGWFTVPPTFAQRIKIATDKFNYVKNEAIRATVANGSDKPIQGMDLKSHCSILELHRLENDRWVTTGQCFLRRASLPVNIRPGETLPVDLLSSAASAPSPPGVYRLALVFRVVEDEKTLSDYFTAFSPLFRIHEMPARDGVSVAVDRGTYALGQGIKVTIDNNTDRMIQTFDHQTHCTIVTLQRLRGGSWSNVAECPLLTPTRTINLEPRHSLSVKLPDERFTADFEPGTYRVEFIYSDVDGSGRAGKPGKIYSARFTILP